MNKRMRELRKEIVDKKTEARQLANENTIEFLADIENSVATK